MNVKKNSERKSLGIWILFFVITLVFFLAIHPVTILDGDDWANLSMSRGAYPKWGAWNPSKVFPEIFFPIVGYISAFIVKPLGFDYLTSLTVTTAVVISIFIATFIFNVSILLRKNFGLSYRNSFLTSLILYMAIFGIFKSYKNNENIHLLWSINLTCYFHYLIPAVLNATMVVYLSYKELSFVNIKKMPSLNFGSLLVVVYLCIFSNVFSSIIISAYCASKSLIDFIGKRKISEDNVFYYGVVLAWLCAAFFEANGGRASSIGGHSLKFVECIVSFYHVMWGVDKIFVILIAALLISFSSVKTYTLFKRKNIEIINTNVLEVIALSFIFCLFGILIISAKSSPYYVTRPDAMWGIYFYVLLLIVLLLGELITITRKLEYLLPFILLLIFTRVVLSEGSFREPFMLNISYEDVVKIDNFIIQQVIDADENNLKEVTIYVPKGDDNDNWPFPTYMGHALSSTLQKHGIITNTMDIHIHPDANVNKKLLHKN